MRTEFGLFLVAIAGMLSGCGGGGGGGGISAPPTFRLQSSLSTLYAQGYQKGGLLAGTATDAKGAQYSVSGNLTNTATPSGATTFNGQSAVGVSISTTETILVNGQNITQSNSVTNYYSPNYQQELGNVSQGEYCLATVPGSIPDTVVIGDQGVISTTNCFTDPSMKVALGSIQTSYIVIPGLTPTQAVVSLIQKSMNTAGNLTSTTDFNYTLDTTGNLTFLSWVGYFSSNGYIFALNETT